MSVSNDINRALAEQVPGPEKIKALLKAKGLTQVDFARKYDHWREDVSRCIAGTHPLPAIRDDLAAELGFSRSAIDRLIDGEEGK